MYDCASEVGSWVLLDEYYTGPRNMGMCVFFLCVWTSVDSVALISAKKNLKISLKIT